MSLLSVGLMSISLAVFCIFVAPLWLFLHYRSKQNTDTTFLNKDVENLEALVRRTENLQNRINTLENILDIESSDWRNRHG